MPLGVFAGMTIERWWPTATIGLDLVMTLAQQRVSLGPALVSGFGLALLADQQNWMAGDARSGRYSGRDQPLTPPHAGAPRPGRSPPAMFGGAWTVDRSQHLTHADVSAVFGGATLDLREAQIDENASVDALALFRRGGCGGAQGMAGVAWWRAGFGGHQDKTTGNDALPADALVLTVNVTTIFGAVEVADGPK